MSTATISHPLADPDCPLCVSGYVVSEIFDSEEGLAETVETCQCVLKALGCDDE